MVRYKVFGFLLFVFMLLFSADIMAFAELQKPPAVPPDVQNPPATIFNSPLFEKWPEGWEPGKRLYEQGSFEKAIIFLREYVKENPNKAGAWYWLGRCYEAVGDYEIAQECFNRALAIDPLYPDLAILLKKKWQKESEKDPFAPPRLFTSARKIAVECLSSRGTKTKREAFAAAVASEIEARLSRIRGIEVVDATFNPDLASDVDFKIVVSVLGGGTLKGTVGYLREDVPIGVNVKVIDAYNDKIIWSENIWLSTVLSEPKLDTVVKRTLAVRRTVNRLFELWELAEPFYPTRRQILAERQRASRGLLTEIVKVTSGKKVMIEGGYDRGFKVGMKFMVFRNGAPIVAPSSGRFLGYDEIVLGYGKITAVRDKMSYAVITKYIRKDIAVGDKVRVFPYSIKD